MAQLPAQARSRIRKTMIDIARRRQRPGRGSWTLAPDDQLSMNWPDLTGILDGMRWAVVGGVATRMYMPERATKDLDIAIRSEDAPQVYRRLSDAGFTMKGRLTMEGTAWSAGDGTPLDVLELDAEWSDDALLYAASNKDVTGAPVMPLPYLVLMKFRSGRLQDIADIGRMLVSASGTDLDAVRSVLRRFERDALDDLDATIELARLEQRHSPD